MGVRTRAVSLIRLIDEIPEMADLDPMDLLL
jgi:hypothetical protein